MKEKIIAVLASLSFLLAVAKFATSEILELLKYIAVQSHDFWVFLVAVFGSDINRA